MIYYSAHTIFKGVLGYIPGGSVPPSCKKEKCYFQKTNKWKIGRCRRKNLTITYKWRGGGGFLKCLRRLCMAPFKVLLEVRDVTPPPGLCLIMPYTLSTNHQNDQINQLRFSISDYWNQWNKKFMLHYFILDIGFHKTTYQSVLISTT